MSVVRVATLASAVALLGSPYAFPDATPALVALTGLLLTVCVLPALGDDRLLKAAVVASYVVKASLTFVLFYVSSMQVPFLATVHLGNGFWRFARDAMEYDWLAYRIFTSWTLGTLLPELGPERGQIFYVAGVYYGLGPHPLHVALLNAWYGALGVVVAVLTIRRVTTDRRAVRTAALLLSFWPSLTLWSTQMLKDPIVLFLLLSETYLLVVLWERPPASRARRALHWGLAAVVPFVMQFFRDYLAFILACSAVVGFGAAALLGRGVRAPRLLVRSVVLGLVVSVSTLLGSNLNLVNVLQPRHPEFAHMRLGLMYQRERNFDRAIEEYSNAIRARPGYFPAYRNLAVALELKREPEQGLYFLKKYQAGNVPPADAALVAEEIARLDGIVNRHQPWTPPRLPPVDVSGQPAPHDWQIGERLQLTENKLHLLDNASAAYLGGIRRGMVREGGTSLVDSKVRIRTTAEALRYLPRGLSIVFFAPFPWEWEWPRLGRAGAPLTKGGAGPLKAFAALEALVMQLLIPVTLVALAGVVRRRAAIDLFLAVFVALLAAAFAIAIPNLGTLFRLRLQVIVPLLVLLATSGALTRVFDVLGLLLRRRPACPPGDARG